MAECLQFHSVDSDTNLVNLCPRGFERDTVVKVDKCIKKCRYNAGFTQHIRTKRDKKAKPPKNIVDEKYIMSIACNYPHKHEFRK